MTSKKLPSLLTDEELLSLLDNPDVPDDVSEIFNEQQDDVVSFLQNYKIEPGPTKVNKKLIYKLYKQYSKDPLTQKQFTTRVNHYITDTDRQFLINKDQFALSAVIYESEKKRDLTKSLTYQKHFNWFLQETSLGKGKNWLEGFILFDFYKEFCKERRINTKLGYVNFHKFLKLNFDHRRLKENRALWFKISDPVYNKISEETKQTLRKARET